MMTRCMAAIIAIALAGDPANCVAQQSSGQAAYGAIGEIVRMLKADPSTDWSNVNVEALRQHLIDMNDVTMQSVVEQRNILGGIEVDVTGTSRTIAAIRRMTTSHSRTLEQGDDTTRRSRRFPTAPVSP
ncbi:MAG: hypothetical protein M3068_13455 [Gemmatimonadota bacterium]|nr:hypothetical protein [Gemmatimonadota bacterium]